MAEVIKVTKVGSRKRPEGFGGTALTASLGTGCGVTVKLVQS